MKPNYWEYIVLEYIEYVVQKTQVFEMTHLLCVFKASGYISALQLKTISIEALICVHRDNVKIFANWMIQVALYLIISRQDLNYFLK